MPNLCRGMQVPDFPNYVVFENGVVMNKHGLVLKPNKSNSGYLRVSLSNDRVKHRHFSIHRLVAGLFIPNPNNLPQVNHIDGDKTHNEVSNLEWCTALENLNHSKVIEKASAAKFTRVRCIDTGKIYDSIKDACSEMGVSHSNVVACCNGRREKCGGVRWQYV